MRFLFAFLAWCLVAGAVLLGASTAPAATPSCAEGPETVAGTTYGTPCDDLIVAPAGVEAVKGGGGDDTILAAAITAASDCPSGCFLGVGSQTFEGGPGNDVVFGERGNDTLKGGEGDDQLFGGIGDDLIQGGPGNDRLAGGFGADSIDGQGGDDYVRGDATIDRIFDTGGGSDTLSFSTGVTPGFGDSVPIAGFPPSGGERGVELEMGAGGQNADNGVAPFGGGVDEVEAANFETVIGTPFSDHLVGTAAPQAFYGGGGADAIEGGGGGDTLVGGADGDYLDGGTAATRDSGLVSVGMMTPPGATPYTQLYVVGSGGNDKITAAYSPAAATFQLAAGEFDQSPSDDGGCEIETATKATCALAQPLDSLLLAGMGGDDTIVAGGFPATAGVVAIGGEGGDAITGRDGEDILVDGPGSGADVLSALGGDDALTHNGGADQLLGGEGNDLFLSDSICDGEEIVGGPGRDNSSWARLDAGVAADLEAGVAGDPGSGGSPECGSGELDSMAEIEDLEASSAPDVLRGDAGPNQLLGHLGADVYAAAAGEDSILANSGDSDPQIDCGADADRALVDFPEYGDAAPINCETVTEAAPNSFQAGTKLPPPPLEKPPPATEPVPPSPVKPPRDRTAPQTRLGFHPRATVFSARTWRTVGFRFTASEPGAHFRCKLDVGPYRACASPRTYRVKAGRHAFRVVAVDAAGNADPTAALFKFAVRRR
ncbi:MAG TPA: calcium-binding protein [Solirubrobacterales bacterium]|nr:calcium-binding protein [Solirubrobacterales bacterium]